MYFCVGFSVRKKGRGAVDAKCGAFSRSVLVPAKMQLRCLLAPFHVPVTRCPHQTLNTKFVIKPLTQPPFPFLPPSCLPSLPSALSPCPKLSLRSPFLPLSTAFPPPIPSRPPYLHKQAVSRSIAMGCIPKGRTFETRGGLQLLGC